jgi:hypothetical protein
MLTAAIVYVPGSGGNLLARTLSLAAGTVAYLPDTLAAEQTLLDPVPDQRFALYNNWNHSNWTNTETSIGMWYHHGLNDFVDYELSSLKLIDQFHPAMFAYETQRQILWNSVAAWENLVFIKYRPESLVQIINLAQVKRKDLSHAHQIKTTEASCFAQLQEQYPNHLAIWWEDMLQLDSYIKSIKQLAEQLSITVDLELATQLWQCWNYNTNLIIK